MRCKYSGLLTHYVEQTEIVHRLLIIVFITAHASIIDTVDKRSSKEWDSQISFSAIKRYCFFVICSYLELHMDNDAISEVIESGKNFYSNL